MFNSPISPAHMNWGEYYPSYVARGDDKALGDSETVGTLTQDVEVADIGCGFGGLLVALAPKLPNTLILGA